MAFDENESKSEQGLSQDELLMESAWCSALTRITEGFVHRSLSKLTGIYSSIQLCQQRDVQNHFAEEFANIKLCSEGLTDLLQVLRTTPLKSSEVEFHDLKTILSDSASVIRESLKYPDRLQLVLSPEPLIVKAAAVELKRAIILLVFQMADATPEKAKVKLESLQVAELPPQPTSQMRRMKLPCACIRISSEEPTAQALPDEKCTAVQVARQVLARAHGFLHIESSPAGRSSFLLILPKRKI